MKSDLSGKQIAQMKPDVKKATAKFSATVHASKTGKAVSVLSEAVHRFKD
jgi:hypothetical protein